MKRRGFFAGGIRAAAGVATLACVVGAATLLPISAFGHGALRGSAWHPGNNPIPFVLTIAANPKSVELPKPFVLSGMLAGAPGTNGLLIAVYVKKPGSGRWSYSSTRGTYDAGAASSLWWYRYAPKLRGTYHFYASSVSTAAPTPNSNIVGVTVR